MDTFEWTLSVREEDLDDLRHVNNVRFVQWVQDISKAHWQKVAPEELQKNRAWVVMSHHIAYKGPALLGDVIRIRTFIAETHGAISKRVVEMFHDKTKRLLLRSSTEWCLLNAQTGRPIRISDDIKRLFKSAV